MKGFLAYRELAAVNFSAVLPVEFQVSKTLHAEVFNIQVCLSAFVSFQPSPDTHMIGTDVATWL